MRPLTSYKIRFTKVTRLAAMLLTSWSLCSPLCAMASVPTAGPGVPVRDQTDGPIIFSLGIAIGQTLRLTVAYPSDNKVQDERVPPVRVEAILYNSLGQVIHTSDERAINHQGFVSFNFRRADLALPGEIGTGRLQVLAEIRYRFFTIVDGTHAAVQPVLTAEVIDDETGKTVSSVVFFKPCTSGTHY